MFLEMHGADDSEVLFVVESLVKSKSDAHAGVDGCIKALGVDKSAEVFMELDNRQAVVL